MAKHSKEVTRNYLTGVELEQRLAQHRRVLRLFEDVAAREETSLRIYVVEGFDDLKLEGVYDLRLSTSCDCILGAEMDLAEDRLKHPPHYEGDEDGALEVDGGPAVPASAG